MRTAPPESQRATSRVRAWSDRFQSRRAVVLAWVVTRLLMLGLLAAPERFIVGDVFYYHRKIAALTSVGLGKTLNEYPTPVVWILSLPYGATGGGRTGYLIAFIIFMLALDAGFTWALWRAAGRRRDSALDFWLFFVFLIGPLCYVRFDMLPAVLAGGALGVPWGRPRAGHSQPDFRGLDPARLAIDLAVGPRAADRVHLGHAADDGPSPAARRVDRGLLEVPGLRDLRTRRVSVAPVQQPRQHRRIGRDHRAVCAGVPQSTADAGRDWPGRSGHGRHHDGHQQDAEPAVPAVARRADGGAVDLARPGDRTGEAHSPAARNPTLRAGRLDPAGLPTAVQRHVGPPRHGNDHHLDRGHHGPQSRLGRLHRRSLPIGVAAAARNEQRVSTSAG